MRSQKHFILIREGAQEMKARMERSVEEEENLRRIEWMSAQAVKDAYFGSDISNGNIEVESAIFCLIREVCICEGEGGRSRSKDSRLSPWGRGERRRKSYRLTTWRWQNFSTLLRKGSATTTHTRRIAEPNFSHQTFEV